MKRIRKIRRGCHVLLVLTYKRLPRNTTYVYLKELQSTNTICAKKKLVRKTEPYNTPLFLIFHDVYCKTVVFLFG